MKLLIISYYFPPHPTVGSRRWTKFAKYFSRMGHQVDVIASAAPSGARSSWDEDIDPAVNIDRISARYPLVLDSVPQTYFSKAIYRFALLLIRYFSRGTPFDRAIFWKKPLMAAIERYAALKGSPDLIFASGPPFRVLYYATQLKKRFPNVKVVCDFRDPWTWWYNLGYPTLKISDRRTEEQMEAEVLKSADCVLAAAEPIEKHLKTKYELFKRKIILVPHGFDPAVIPVQRKASPASAPRRLIYFGTLYPFLENSITALTTVLGLEKNVTLDMFAFSKNYEQIFRKFDPTSLLIQYKEPLPEKELFLKLVTYDLVLFFNFPSAENNISTKFHEVIHCRVPILLIGPDGEAAKFVTENRLGFHVKESDIENDLPKIFKGEITLFYNDQFDTSSFSFDLLAEKLLKNVAHH
jgi:glycosyltransferase involved in cell wall biosynthesis